MIQRASIEIDRPIDEVFEYTNHNVPKWSLTVVSDEVIEQTPEEVGTTFLCVTENQGQRMEFQGTVTHYEPPKFSAVELVGAQFDIEARYAFEDLGGRTRVTQVSSVKPKTLAFKIIFGCFGWLMKKSSCNAANKEMESLKRHLENDEAP